MIQRNLNDAMLFCNCRFQLLVEFVFLFHRSTQLNKMEFNETWFTYFQFTVFVFRFLSLNNNFVESTTGDGVKC